MATDLQPRILMILTGHGDLGGRRPTGFYASEAADPWGVFTQAGYAVDVVTVGEGAPPVDGRVADDPIQQRFFASVDLSRSACLREVAPEDLEGYAAVFLPGGHGTMWDFPQEEVGRAVSTIWAAGGAVAAVCHGPAGLLGARDVAGEPLVSGRQVTGFSNTEESAAGVADVVPFLLADALSEQGGRYSAGEDFTEHVVTDGRLVTGQNPASAHGVAHALIEVLCAPASSDPRSVDADDAPLPDVVEATENVNGEPLVWLITGASSGFGRAIAEEAATRGDLVLATARDENALSDLAAGHPGLLTARLDVTDPGSIRSACDEALARFGRIDVLVNNAGYGLRGAVEEWDLDDLRAQMDTNVYGPVLTTRAVLPSMRARRRGWIVQMSSVGGVDATLGGTAYAASKFALEGLSEGLAAEVAPFDIDVTIVEPGPFRTDFAGRSTRWSPTLAPYRDILAQPYDGFRAQDGRQPNSPRRAAQILVDLAHAPNRPLRLPMGPESFDRIRATLTRRLEALPTLEVIARDTAHPEGVS